jgi:hypothetical protein
MRKGEKQNMTNLKLGNLNHTLNMLFGSQKLTTYANKSYLLDSPHRLLCCEKFLLVNM